MKQALVLGLAFAANAMTAEQVDNELIVAPTGGKFGDLAKLPTKMGRVMFDEQAADEELFVAPQGKLADLAKKYPGMILFDEQADDELIIMNIPREKFKTEQEWKRYLMSRSEEVADDELMVRLLPRESFPTEEEYQKYLAKWRFHRDDDELFVAPEGRLGELAKKYPGKIMFDEQADDELLIRPIVQADDDEFIAMLLPREHFKTEEEYQKYVAKMRFHRDDELFVAPEGKLGELAKKYPGKIMFDEADDELLIRPIVQADDDEFMVRLLPRESFQTEEDYQKYLAKMRFHRDDEELFVAPQGKLGELVKKHPGMIMFDEQADDELMVYYTKDSQGNKHYEGGYTVRRDDAADDELAYLSGADLVKYAKQSQQTVYRPTAHVVRDDEADDELVQTFYSPSGADLVKYAKQSQQTVYRPTAHVVRDDADDELMVYYTKDSQGNRHYEGGYTVRRDDEADDEFVQTFYSPSGADLVKFAKQSQQTVYRPTAHVVRDDADDELVQTFYSPSGADLVKYAKQSQQTVYRPTAHVVRDDADDELSLIPVRPKVFGDKGLTKPAKIATSEALVRDDEADDELVYLGQLIRHAENQRLPPVRTFDDDELRAEKPAHVKAQEKAQMKAELPKMKRKLRPTDETAFLA